MKLRKCYVQDMHLIKSCHHLLHFLEPYMKETLTLVLYRVMDEYYECLKDKVLRIISGYK
jgi:hypothetical protein